MTMLEKVTGARNLRYYYGKWFEIASILKGHNFYANTKTTYTLRSHGEVKVTEFYERWSASERRFIKGQEEIMHKSCVTRDDPLFWVVHRDVDYQYALLHNSRILCKQPYLDRRIYKSLLVKATEEGFDVAKIRKTSKYQREVVVQVEKPIMGRVTWEHDLRKYIGQWYEIASFSPECDYLEKRRTTYSLTDNGGVDYCYCILNGREQGGGGRYTPNELLFSVVHFDDDDQCALLDHKNSQILYKQPQMDEGIYNQLVEKIKEQGIDINKRRKTSRFQDEIVINLVSDEPWMTRCLKR